MWKVAICSNMRAGSDYETAYYLQILALQRHTFEIASVNVIYDREPTESEWARRLLNERGIPVRYEIERSSGTKVFTNMSDKFRQWAAIGNQGLDLAFSTPEGLTHLAAVEADLTYPYDVFEILLARQKPIIAPMIYLGNTFYDSWGFRDLRGEKIHEIRPVSPQPGQPTIELNSVGSFVLFDIAIFQSGIRYRGEDCDHGLLVGACEDARAKGFATFVDPTVSVLHPVTAWRQQLWRLKRLKILVDGTIVHEQELSDGPILAGPHEEIVRPLIEPGLDQNFGAGHRRIYSVTPDGAARTVDVTVDVMRA